MKLSDDMKARLSALFFISAVEVAAYFCMPLAPRNEFYYAIAGGFNFLTLMLITTIKNTRLKIDLMRLTCAQLTIQFVGWAMYSLYMPAHFYNWGIYAMVGITYLRIFWVGRNDGDIAVHLDRRLLYRAIVRRFNHSHGVHK
jgi:hypothetical protein